MVMRAWVVVVCKVVSIKVGIWTFRFITRRFTGMAHYKKRLLFTPVISLFTVVLRPLYRFCFLNIYLGYDLPFARSGVISVYAFGFLKVQHPLLKNAPKEPLNDIAERIQNEIISYFCYYIFYIIHIYVCNLRKLFKYHLTRSHA